ncbi:MAG: ABC transporter permease/substrate-binding protein [Vicinamibacterales bacterium]
MTALLSFWSSHTREVWTLIEQHLVLVVLSTAVAAAIGIPTAILASRHPRLGRVLLFAANIAQTIPSLALLGFLLPLPWIGGIGPRTALVALTLYSLLPIVRATISGFRSIDPAVIEAGTALGMTPRQLLLIVQLPLALPSIVSGIRVATVIGVGTATIAAAIGAGGLGEYIFRGLAMVDATTILAGAVPAAVMAIALDGALAWLEAMLARGARLRPLVAGAVLVMVLAVVIVGQRVGGGPAPIVVGSKNFTEQIVLGEIVAQVVEQEGFTVSRKLNLGGTLICDAALRAGGIDVYVEYTGTAVTAIFKDDTPVSSADALERTRARYRPLGVTVTAPLGFNNTFAMLVRSADAAALKLTSIADLSRVSERFRPGFGHEFLQRRDGFAGLTARYGLVFSVAPRAMELSLIYKALADGQVDLIAGDATGALVDALDLVMLEDTLKYFPPYDAVPLARSDTLARHPAVARALARLGGRISEATMRGMNRAVDVDHISPRDVAERFVSTLPRS